MVKDLELIQDITPLFARKSVIWGIGKNGRKLLEEMLDMDAGKKGIYLCDTDSRRWGEDIGGMKILSPDVLSEKIAEAELKDINILIPVLSIQVQDEIIKNIKNLCVGGGIYKYLYLVRYRPGSLFKYKKSACKQQIPKKKIIRIFRKQKAFERTVSQ